MTLLLLLWACSGEETPPPVEPPPAAIEAPAPAPTPASGPELPRVPATTASRLAASHVLVQWAGGVGALPTVTRTREEAKARAEEARAKILAGADFADIAKAYSDAPEGARGGSLGGFPVGTMVEPFEKAVQALQVGQVSEIVETSFGYHVIRRDALAEVHVAHLMITWAGAERAPSGVTRSKDEAHARIEEVAGKLASGGDWGKLVQTYSDGPLKDDGGDLGWFGRGQLAPALDKVALDLDIGATSTIVESPMGFHLLRRLE